MPHCSWYADLADHTTILDWLFSEDTCEVYELNSAFETPLTRFRSTAEILAQFDRTFPNGKKWDTVHLALHVTDAGPDFRPERVSVNPAACDGATHRWTAGGWGLVTFYLSIATATGLRYSTTNHNSEKRAQAGYRPEAGVAPPEAWDFKRINQFSSRLNRRIRKEGVAKLRSHAVLPAAYVLWGNGQSLLPYRPDTHADMMMPR